MCFLKLTQRRVSMTIIRYCYCYGKRTWTFSLSRKILWHMLTTYDTGYVTKAEKSNLQDLWQEVGSNKSIYSRLWSFGVRSLRSRECGLYEAIDIYIYIYIYIYTAWGPFVWQVRDRKMDGCFSATQKN